MLSGLAPVRFGPRVKQCSNLLSGSTRACLVPVARSHPQIRVRNSSSKSNLPFIPKRRFRSNASEKAAISNLHLFDESPLPNLYQPPPPPPPGQLVYDVEDKAAYWQKIPRWKDVSESEWLSSKFQTGQTASNLSKLESFMRGVLPPLLPPHPDYPGIKTSEDFIRDVVDGVKRAPMSIRIPPHILSIIDWENPFEDPIRRQFIAMKSTSLPDHPKLEFDSLHESQDQPERGFIHRYHDKLLFLATHICPLYCRFCTRSYSIGPETENDLKKVKYPPELNRWNKGFEYIEKTTYLSDVVVSGGDCYMLSPDNLRLIGERLLKIPHIKRIRFATKGLAVMPSKILDETDTWATEMINLSAFARKMGKSVAIHTHFNHPREITWITERALQKLWENSVTVRNQTVLLRGVNDSLEVMSELIRKVADNNVIPYYVYQADMVPGTEDLRTPLSYILWLERQIRGSIGGFVTPNFVVDLPGGGGKRLAASFDSYDPVSGRSTFTAPSVTINGKKDKVYEYWDPHHSLQKKKP